MAAERATAGPLRWGIVGTGSIANWMATMIQLADDADIGAVSSRRMESANTFGDQHGIDRRFDDWRAMLAWDGIDAVYAATPTSIREEICVAAAKAGKHVLGEKPFASFPSLRRITAACRANGVGFMDGTHFVHHPRTAAIRKATAEQVGWPWSLATAFQFPLPDKSNIRFNPDLEPMGAIGDAGWYNMRAAVEFLPGDLDVSSVAAYPRRDGKTGAVVSASGVIRFADGSTTTWNCGFDSGAVIMDLRLTGADGVISMDNFLANEADGSAAFTYRKGGFGPNAVADVVVTESAKPGPALMFEDFATMVGDSALIDASISASEKTQRLLDAIWLAAVNSERDAS